MCKYADVKNAKKECRHLKDLELLLGLKLRTLEFNLHICTVSYFHISIFSVNRSVFFGSEVSFCV
jgi:hypothetical protein